MAARRQDHLLEEGLRAAGLNREEIGAFVAYSEELESQLLQVPAERRRGALLARSSALAALAIAAIALTWAMLQRTAGEGEWCAQRRAFVQRIEQLEGRLGGGPGMRVLSRAGFEQRDLWRVLGERVALGDQRAAALARDLVAFLRELPVESALPNQGREVLVLSDPRFACADGPTGDLIVPFAIQAGWPRAR